jgi:hypothetical protein
MDRMKSQHAPKRARFAAALALVALALPAAGCFMPAAAPASQTPAEPEKREAPPIPEPGPLQDAALEKQLIDRMIANGEITAAKVIFTEDDWSIERNESSGIVESRYTRATVLYKKTDGTCWQDPSLLEQQYVGTEFVGPGEWAILANEPYEIPCEKAGL